MLNPDGRLTIDLAALRENYKIIQDRVGRDVRISAVVKANAFGLGAAPVSKALYESGCRDFFVAKPAEGIGLRKTIADGNIYILNGFYRSYEQAYLTYNLIPVIGSFIEIDEYTQLGKSAGKKLPAVLKFNTRMNRMGFAKAEQDTLWADMSRLSGIEARVIMSHLACADEPDNPMNEKQYELFSEVVSHFPEATKSLCNSPGIFLDKKFHFGMVRPGYALYGGNPLQGKPNPMRPVVHLDIPIIRTRLLYKDAAIGYGATYRFDKDAPVATLAAGYADGIFRSLSNKGAFYWNGIRCPIRGRVSMDLTSVDLSDVSEAQRPKPGDYMEVLGPHQSIDDLAKDAGTIGYEILTNLGSRYERKYI